MKEKNTGSNKNGKFFAALDLGTNSCRMLVVRTTDNHFEVQDSFSKTVELGQALESTGYLSRASIEKTMRALKICKSKFDKYPTLKSKLVATEACRRAKNGEEFLKRVYREIGLKLEIIRPEEEAKYAVIGCAPLMNKNFENVLVIDIGGGSTELVWLQFKNCCGEDRLHHLVNIDLRNSVSNLTKTGSYDGRAETGKMVEVVDWLSIPLGVSTLSEKYSDIDQEVVKYALMACDFEDYLSSFLPYNSEFYLSEDRDIQVIGTSGTITTIGAVHLGLKKYDRELVDGLQITSDEVEVVVKKLFEMGSVGRQNHPAIGPSRCNLIIPGVAIIQTVLRSWQGNHMSIADRGLRDGILQSLIKKNSMAN